MPAGPNNKIFILPNNPMRQVLPLSSHFEEEKSRGLERLSNLSRITELKSQREGIRISAALPKIEIEGWGRGYDESKIKNKRESLPDVPGKQEEC